MPGRRRLPRHQHRVRTLPEREADEVVRHFQGVFSTETQAADVVITMGCGDACPIFPGKRNLDWQLDDPTGKPVEQVRPIRGEIDRRVKALLAELVPAST